MEAKHFLKAKHLKKMKWPCKRLVSLVLSVVLLLGCITFSTLAWVTYKKVTAPNVFVGSKLQVTMGNDVSEQYYAIPGETYPVTGDQIPKVVVKANSIDCYVYALCEFYWYDFADPAQEQYPMDWMYRSADVLHDPYNDTYRPNRPSGAAQGNDDDYGFIDYFGFDGRSEGLGNYVAYNTDSYLIAKGVRDITDAQGNIIGRRYLFGYRTKTGEEYFQTADSDRFIYVFEGNSKNCRFSIGEYLTKEQIATFTEKNAPKVVVTGYAVQQAGLTRDQATELVAESIANGRAEEGVIQ